MLLTHMRRVNTSCPATGRWDVLRKCRVWCVTARSPRAGCVTARGSTLSALPVPVLLGSLLASDANMLGYHTSYRRVVVRARRGGCKSSAFKSPAATALLTSSLTPAATWGIRSLAVGLSCMPHGANDQRVCNQSCTGTDCFKQVRAHISVRSHCCT